MFLGKIKNFEQKKRKKKEREKLLQSKLLNPNLLRVFYLKDDKNHEQIYLQHG